MTIELKPHERAALIVAWSQVKRGEFPMPACATVCVAALARLTELDGPDDAPEMQPTLNAITSMAQRIAVIATGCQDKEPEQLTDQEKIALAIIGGCAWERTDTGIRVTDAFGIQKINGKFIVARRPL